MVHIADKDHRGKYNNAHTGEFIPRNPGKYVGKEKPIYKSALELKFMMYVDSNPNIISWGYEGTTIKYYDRSKGKVRRYFIDFSLVIKAGPIKKTIWVEVKPESETHAPKGKLRNSTQAQLTWITNQCKWEAAKALAKSKGYEFHIITERQLNGG